MSNSILLLIAASVALMAADPTWKNKPAREWTVDEAHQVLDDSPWSKKCGAGLIPLQTEDERREGGNMGQPRGIGYDGIPDDRPRPELPHSPLDIVKPEADARRPTHPYTLQLRWESALPVRVAELKAGVIPPPISEGDDQSYVIAVYGVPTAKVKGDPKSLGQPLKSLAVLRRQGKKDVKPSSVEVFQAADGMVVVYVFPLAAEIAKNDRLVEFVAQIGRLDIQQYFNLEEMQFQGRLEM